MSQVPPAPENPGQGFLPNAPSTSFQAPKPHRVLACVLCQQRKTKCDRKFPCATCIKARVQCVPATLTPRRRKRRFPERELLERLRTYEDLLRQNNIAFDPLHKGSSKDKESQGAEEGHDSEHDHQENMAQDASTPSTTIKSESGYEAKNIWHAMSQGFRDWEDDSDSSQDPIRETAFKKAWEQSVTNDDHLFFGSHIVSTNLANLHPNPVQIFRLWQTYLDNVHPLLKVTHTPTLQGRIIEAASNVSSIDANLEALMFSIYCISIESLSKDDCQAMFGSPKEDMVLKFRPACQQALSNCSVLRTTDLDCLTALYLYLLSVSLTTLPQSLSSMLGLAIRIAQRMGIHSESTLTKSSPLEAEVRRRLWWSLVLFDSRISELSHSRAVTLEPSWDCKIPLNVGDSDLRPEMKSQPVAQKSSTEAVLAVVRGEIGEFLRHSTFYLDFTCPALKLVAKHSQNDNMSDERGLDQLETIIEDKYLKSCDPENPIHFMTIWTARSHIARCRLIEHLSRHADAGVHRTEAQRALATSHALRVLECDTKIMTSPLTKRFAWLNRFYFPFPAYIQTIQDLRRQSVSEQALYAWEVMSDNYEAWFDLRFGENTLFFQIFAKIVLEAWSGFEAASTQLAQDLVPPRIVLSIRNTLAQIAQSAQDPGTQPLDISDMAIDDFAIPTSAGFTNQNLLYGMGMENSYAMMGPGMYSSIPRRGPFNSHMNQVDWSALTPWPGWGG